MGHFAHGETRAEAPPREWMKVGSEVGQLANEWAGRSDLVAYVGPGAGGPAPARFIPASAEIEVNVDIAFGSGVEPEDVNLLTRSGRYDFPRGTGAVLHEAFHARFSLWDIEQASKDLKADEFAALMLLEESRIETLGAKIAPKALPFLRACALEIVIGDSKEIFSGASDTKSLAKLVALVYGRVDGGILPLYDVSDLTDLLDDYFGLDKITALRDIQIEAQAYVAHSNIVPIYPLAIEWARIVREVAEDKGDAEPEGGEGSEGEGSESGEGSGEGSGMSDFMKAVKEALEGAAEAVAVANDGALGDQERAEKYEEVVGEKAAQAQERKSAEKAREQVFGKPGGVGSSNVYGSSDSRLYETRVPEADERVAANVVAKMLERAKYHDRSEVEVQSVLPPGRLRTRALIQGVAQKSRGQMVEVAPWRRTVRKTTDDVSLTVGTMVDISGSMGRAMLPMAVTAYVMSEAVRKVQGRTAMVYFGTDVFPTLRPGEHLTEVKVYTAPDGTERFEKGFQALDGALNLLYGTGARLLVVVSDGNYHGPENGKAKALVKRCADMGVGVVWLPFDDGSQARSLVGKNGTVLSGNLSPANAAQDIGKACADALTRAGRRMAG